MCHLGIAPHILFVARIYPTSDRGASDSARLLSRIQTERLEAVFYLIHA